MIPNDYFLTAFVCMNIWWVAAGLAKTEARADAACSLAFGFTCVTAVLVILHWWTP